MKFFFIERQLALDEITKEVLSQLAPEEILAHNLKVYSETIGHFTAAPEHQNIIDELVLFMNLGEIPNGSKIVDLGCGFGRDALFMSCSDFNFRERMMQRMTNGITTVQKYLVPTKAFQILGIDGCPQMIESAYEKREAALIENKFDSLPLFILSDIHDLDPFLLHPVAGIWSCAALFTHTPKPLVGKVLAAIKATLGDNGIFGVSYTQSFSEDTYDKLLLSRTGKIKYFSQPTASYIENEAGKLGFRKIYQNQNDFSREGKTVAKSLLVTQFFQKQ